MDKVNAGLTSLQMQDQIARLRNEYPVVRLVSQGDAACEKCLIFDDDAVCGKKIAEKLFAQHGGDEEWSLRLGGEAHKATARYVEVEGEPRVLMCVADLDDAENEHDRHLLHTDVLTGVFNRRFYEDELRRQRLFAGVAIIDLDDFKLVNDTLGHHAGDVALKAAADAMSRCVRETDMLIRYGGDEFVLVMPNIESSVFSRRLHAILEAVSQTPIPNYGQQFLSCSIGGVIARGETVEDAVQQADGLMYRAKRSKNAVLTDSDPIETTEYRNPMLLIVDDSEMNREILGEMLKDDYEIIEAKNGLEALQELEQHGKEISLVLLDIIMPEVSGFEVLLRMVNTGWIEDIPVIMISSEDSDEAVLRAYELGASDYISRPFDTRVVRQRVSNIMRLYSRQRRLSALLARQYYEREKSSNVLVNIMGGAMELRNGESGPHVLHVRNLTEILLERLIRKTDKYNITGEERANIAMASTLHDIGKLAIPDEILNKPGKLTDEEFEIMKTHTTVGASMLDKLDMYDDSPLLLQTAHDICRWHHERWDGGGYPDGLKGDDIPISAQVVSMADVYDALTSERVYKKAVPHETAMQMILDGKCGQFNPLLIECLVESSDRIISELNVPTIAPPFNVGNK